MKQKNYMQIYDFHKQVTTIETSPEQINQQFGKFLSKKLTTKEDGKRKAVYGELPVIKQQKKEKLYDGESLIRQCTSLFKMKPNLENSEEVLQELLKAKRLGRVQIFKYD